VGHCAKVIKLRADDPELVAGIGKAIDDFELGEDAPVVRVLTGSR